MLVIKLFVVVTVCVSSVKSKANNATGWCCPEREDGGGGCPAGAATGDFKPNIDMKNDTVTVTWKTRALTCPPSSTLVYHSNSSEYYHMFILRDEELELLHAPILFDEYTQDYCLEGNDEGQYRIGSCKLDTDKVSEGELMCVYLY